GKNWELISIGYRNQYDMSYNRDGELFTFDSDMEWDMNLPWYKATRVCHAVVGSEFGWRSGTSNFPAYYIDNLPPTLDIGPGSPTGTTFGYGAKFPAKYQDAYFICDWSYGKLYAVHLKPSGSTYVGEAEEFMNGSPLASMYALTVLMRVGGRDLLPRVLEALERIDWAKLDASQKTDYLRVYQLAFIRMGPPDETARKRSATRLDAFYPGVGREVNAE